MTKSTILKRKKIYKINSHLIRVQRNALKHQAWKGSLLLAHGMLEISRFPFYVEETFSISDLQRSAWLNNGHGELVNTSFLLALWCMTSAATVSVLELFCQSHIIIHYLWQQFGSFILNCIYTRIHGAPAPTSELHMCWIGFRVYIMYN